MIFNYVATVIDSPFLNYNGEMKGHISKMCMNDKSSQWI